MQSISVLRLARPFAFASSRTTRPVVPAFNSPNRALGRAQIGFSRAFATAEVSGAMDLVDAVAADHSEIYALYDQYVQSAGNPAAQGRWARQLVWAVGRDSLIKQLVLYPLLTKYLGAQGQKLAEEERAKHDAVKSMLEKIENAPAGTANHAEVFKKVMGVLRPLNDQEEQDELPALQRAMPPGDIEDAARAFLRTKKLVRPA